MLPCSQASKLACPTSLEAGRRCMRIQGTADSIASCSHRSSWSPRPRGWYRVIHFDGEHAISFFDSWETLSLGNPNLWKRTTSKPAQFCIQLRYPEQQKTYPLLTVHAETHEICEKLSPNVPPEQAKSKNYEIYFT